jgi:hypothetical protein
MESKPKKNIMETLLLKMMLSWAIMIIGFIALFAGCNNTHKSNNPENAYSTDVPNDNADSAQVPLPDNTRTDGIKQKTLVDSTIINK